MAFKKVYGGNIRTFRISDCRQRVPAVASADKILYRFFRHGDAVNIDFNAELNSVETQNVSSEFSGNASISAKFWKVKFNASASYKKTTSSTSTTERTYTLGVHVRAVNDELPAGLSRIMDMLEDSIAAV